MADPKEVDVYLWPDGHVVEVDVVLLPVVSASVVSASRVPPRDA